MSKIRKNSQTKIIATTNLEIVAPDRLPTRAVAYIAREHPRTSSTEGLTKRIAGLDHEGLDDAVEEMPVVVSTVRARE